MNALLKSSLWGWQSNCEGGYPASSTMQYLICMCWAVLPQAAAGSWCGFRFPEMPVNHNLLLLHTVALTLGHWTNTHPSTLSTIFAAQAFLTTISQHVGFFFPSPGTLPFEFCYFFWLFLNGFFPSLFIISLKFHVRLNCGMVCFRRRKNRKFNSLFFSPQMNRKKQLLASSIQSVLIQALHRQRKKP